MPNSDNKNFKESTNSTTMPVNSTPKTIDEFPHLFTIKMRDPRGTSEEQEQMAINQDSYFPAHDCIVIINGYPKLAEYINKYMNELKRYNDKLVKLGSSYIIRTKHETIIRGKTYVYIGGYICERTDEPPVEPLKQPMTDSSLRNKSKKSTKKTSKKTTKTKKTKKGETNTNTNMRLKYIERFDYYSWKDLVGQEVISEIGMPPQVPVNKLRFHRVKSNKQETDVIVLPYILYMTTAIKNLFKGCAVFRIP